MVLWKRTESIPELSNKNSSRSSALGSAAMSVSIASTVRTYMADQIWCRLAVKQFAHPTVTQFISPFDTKDRLSHGDGGIPILGK